MKTIGIWQTFKDLFAPSDQPVSLLGLAGRVVFYVVFVVWGIAMIRTPLDDVGMSVMHNVNLPFHEAGHLILGFDGDFLRTLGGTLMQLLIPLVILVAFLVKNHDAFGASVMLWWVGQNFMDIAPYINDARAGEMMLLGGVTGKEMPGYHDWENILGALGWLNYDHLIARLSFNYGVLLMVLALIWGAVVLGAQAMSLGRKPDCHESN